MNRAKSSLDDLIFIVVVGLFVVIAAMLIYKAGQPNLGLKRTSSIPPE